MIIQTMWISHHFSLLHAQYLETSDQPTQHVVSNCSPGWSGDCDCDQVPPLVTIVGIPAAAGSWLSPRRCQTWHKYQIPVTEPGPLLSEVKTLILRISSTQSLYRTCWHNFYILAKLFNCRIEAILTWLQPPVLPVLRVRLGEEEAEGGLLPVRLLHVDVGHLGPRRALPLPTLAAGGQLLVPASSLHLWPPLQRALASAVSLR